MINQVFDRLKTIEANSDFTAYVVGGWVRDYLFGIASEDIDISTNASVSDIIEIFPKALTKVTRHGSYKLIFSSTEEDYDGGKISCRKL